MDRTTHSPDKNHEFRPKRPQQRKEQGRMKRPLSARTLRVALSAPSVCPLTCAVLPFPGWVVLPPATTDFGELATKAVRWLGLRRSLPPADLPYPPPSVFLILS
ncbi:hypothetical protein MLD38_022145 [Melastoma candidum]|uniref:Uncharacterized protein n=1 Tax=Melastoma candidum TaxID=119954 RepID=A0ACB9QIC5_9MYRT|nr:hypothetical protein MLD38_022145 [Melastoma candidum]